MSLAYSVINAAKELDVSEMTIRRLVKKGHLSRIPHTERLLIARVELERFAAQGLQQSSTKGDK